MDWNEIRDYLRSIRRSMRNRRNRRLNKNLSTIYSLDFKVTRFLSLPPTFTGKNTLFSVRNASFFLLGENNNIITNNRNLRPFSFDSNKAKPNKKFVISNFIAGIFKFLNFHKLPDPVKKKYFDCVRRHMIITYDAIKKRLVSQHDNNNQTRTFFRFSVAKYTYYFGIYIPCESEKCAACPTHVTNKGSLCWVHCKKRYQQVTPPPPRHNHVFSNVPKCVHSKRLGIEYTKEISYSERLKAYHVVCSNFHRVSNKTACITRFKRLISPFSNNARRLISDPGESVAQRCKHNSRSIRVSLTSVVSHMETSPPSPTNDCSPSDVSLSSISQLPTTAISQQEYDPEFELFRFGTICPDVARLPIAPVASTLRPSTTKRRRLARVSLTSVVNQLEASSFYNDTSTPPQATSHQVYDPDYELFRFGTTRPGVARLSIAPVASTSRPSTTKRSFDVLSSDEDDDVVRYD